MSRRKLLSGALILIAGSMVVVGGLTLASRVGRSDHVLPGATRTRATTMSLPAGLTLQGELQQTLRSDQSAVGQEFWLKINRPVVINKVVAIAAGSRVRGEVVPAEPSGRVKGRARLALAFRALETESGSYSIIAEPVRLGTKGKEVQFAKDEILRVRLLEPISIRADT